MINVPVIPWIVSPSFQGATAQVVANFTLDTTYRVNLRGGILDKSVVPAVVTVDNTANNNNGVLIINGVAQFISAQTRVTFAIPNGTAYVDTTGISGSSVTLIFYADPRDVAPDQPNYLSLIQSVVSQARLSHGNCYLSKSGATLLLSQKDGKSLIINGVVQDIPSVGVTLGTGGLAAGGIYYIYAFMNGAAMTLEASVTNHVLDGATGVQVKLGDVTRTLVGLVALNLAIAFQDDSQLIGVISYFNRRAKQAVTFFTVDRSMSTGGVYVEIHAEIRTAFVNWADSAVVLSVNGSVTQPTFGAVAQTAISLNAGAPVPGAETGFINSLGGGFYHMLGMTCAVIPAPEGFHFSTLLGGTEAANPATWPSTSLVTGARGRISLHTTIQG